MKLFQEKLKILNSLLTSNCSFFPLRGFLNRMVWKGTVFFLICLTFSGNVDCYYKSNPQQYRGNVSKLADGTPCQAWSGHAPYEHNFNQPEMFPNDESVLAANNYCRQLPGKQGRPWCLAISTAKVWDWCPVPECKHCILN